MKADEDNFYSRLPYTLPQDQCDPPYVILGTGLQQCLIAAYYSKQKLEKGLIIDIAKSYGSCLKTATLKQFNDLNIKSESQSLYQFLQLPQFKIKNDQFYTRCVQENKHRGYNIDLQPNLFLASSQCCQCLKQAQMDKYMDFRLVTNILYVHKGKLKAVPLSKGKIFETGDLSLVEKKTLLASLHQLMKIYQNYMQVEQNINSTNEFDKGFGQVDPTLYNQFQAQQNEYFLPFVSKLVRGNKTILDYLSYIICNYQYNYNCPIPHYLTHSYSLKGFIKNFGKFISSCGVYGDGPYLYVDNGIGDIPQSFSRIASIYGSTYVLHPKIQISAISTQNNSIQLTTNLSPTRVITTNRVYYGPAYHHLCPEQEQCEQKLLRVIIICKTEVQAASEQYPAIAYLTDVFDHPTYLFMFDYGSHNCPKGYLLYQFEVVATQMHDYHSAVQRMIAVVCELKGEHFRDSMQYVSGFVRTRKYSAGKSSLQHIKLKDTLGIDLDGHFMHFVDVVGKQEEYFKKDGVEEEEKYNTTNQLLSQLDNINIFEKDKLNKQQAEQQGGKHKLEKQQTKQQAVEKQNSKQQDSKQYTTTQTNPPIVSQ